MSANLTPKVDSSCNNWSCCKGSPKIKQSPKIPFGGLKSDEEITVTTVYQRHRKPTPPAEGSTPQGTEK